MCIWRYDSVYIQPGTKGNGKVKARESCTEKGRYPARNYSIFYMVLPVAA
nr:MAG TPA: hypothetical protein [Caudoviricetes sp.]